MMKKLLITAVLSLSLFSAHTFLFPSPAHAAIDASCDKSGGFLGFPTWYKYVDVKVDSVTGNCEVELPQKIDPITNKPETDLTKAISNILLAVFEIILRIAGIVAVVFVIFGGFSFMLSQGEPDRVKAARSTIINAMIGLAIVFSATAIVNLIGRNL